MSARRRALLLLVASGLALAGVVVLAAGWVTIGSSTLRAAAAGTEPCLVAYGTDPGVRVRYELVPARAVCDRDVGGTREEVVVAEVPPGLTAGALAAVVVGAAGVAGVVVASRRGRSRSAAAATSSGRPSGTS